MKRTLLTLGAVAAVLCSATASHSAGVNLRWTDCAVDGGPANFTFACGVNTGNRRMIGSWVDDTDQLQVSGVEIVVDLTSQTTPLPAWWQFKNAGSCRPLSLSIAAYDGASCFDWAVGQASMNIASYVIQDGQSPTPPASYAPRPNAARILCVNAVTAQALATLVAGTEYTAFSLVVNNTTGATACGGCLDPVCIVFNSLNVTTAENADNRLFGAAAVPGSNIITWQGVGADCQAVPVRNATWGQVKSLYR